MNPPRTPVALDFSTADAPSNAITGFFRGDAEIDVTDATLVAGVHYVGATGSLLVGGSGGNHANLTFGSDAYNKPVTFVSDEIGGTLIIPGAAPAIAGTQFQQKTSANAPIAPFAKASISDANVIATDTLTITLSGAPGTLTGTGLRGGTNGIYTLSGPLATVNDDLQALIFKPASAPGDNAITNFRLSDQSSGFPNPTTDNITSVIDTVPSLSVKVVTPQQTLEKGQAVDVATVTPGLPGDTLTVETTQGAGIVSLGPVQPDGSQELIYTAPASIANSVEDSPHYVITDTTYNKPTDGSVSVQLDAGPKIHSARPASVGEGQTTVVGTVDPGFSGDLLTLTQLTGAGSLALVAVQGSHSEKVVYTAPSMIGQDTTDMVTYEVADQYDDDMPQGTAAVPLVAPACYCRGTLIATPRGDAAIETLAIGDLVTTASGTPRPIRWIGRRTYAGRLLAKRRELAPVLIRAGALGGGLPRGDLRVSPQHAMFIDGVLVPAGLLINGAGIVRDDRSQRVDYFHLELDSHDVILAEGAPSESFLDDNSRGTFENAQEFAALYPYAPAPGCFCAPKLESGPQLDEIRRRLDGSNVQEARLDADGPHRIAIRQDARALRLVTRSGHTFGDARRLGAAISRITVDGVDQTLDDPRLTTGWHGLEEGWRWTNGAGLLLLSDAREVEVAVVALHSAFRASEL